MSYLQGPGHAWMRVPGYDRNTSKSQDRCRQHSKHLYHVGKTGIDAVFAQDAKQMPIKLHQSPGFAVTLLLTDGIHPYVRRQVKPPHPHRNDMNKLHLLRE